MKFALNTSYRQPKPTLLISKEGIAMRYLFHSLLSIAVCAALAGCNSHHHDEPTHAHDHGGEHDHAHAAHPEEGPHHGELIELGEEEYHAELIHDETNHTITLFILDSAAKNAVPIEAKTLLMNLTVSGSPLQFSIPAAPQADDPSGKSSCFRLTDEKLCEALDSPGATCRLNIEVANRHYTATIGHHHDHASHHR
jgi:hypothetical protein